MLSRQLRKRGAIGAIHRQETMSVLRVRIERDIDIEDRDRPLRLDRQTSQRAPALDR